MNADAGMVAIALLVVLVALCVAGFGVDQWFRNRRPSGGKTKTYTVTPTIEVPPSQLSRLVWKAHTDAERLDTAILTGTAVQIFDELASVQESTRALTDYLIDVEGERL